MYCKQCGAQLPDSALFCNHCGKDTAANAAPERETAPAVASPKKKTALWITAAVVITVLLGAAVLLITGQSKANAVTPEQTLFLEAERLFAEGEYEEVVLQYQAALKINPKNAQAYVGMAEAYAAMGNVKKAQDAIAAGLEKVSAEDRALLEQKLAELAPAGEGENAAQETQVGAAVTQGELTALYEMYLQTVLIPQYGVADLDAIRRSRMSVPEYGDPDPLPVVPLTDACRGILSVCIDDMDQDGVEELICLVSKATPNEKAKSIEPLVFTYTNGEMKQLPGCDGEVLGVINFESVNEFSASLTEKGLRICVLYGHPDGAICWRHSLYGISNGKLERKAMVFDVDGYVGERAVLLYEVPAGMEQLASLPQYNVDFGVIGSDELAPRVLSMRVQNPEDLQEYHPELVGQTFPYSDETAAVNAIVGDMNEGIVLMESLYLDRSGFHGESSDYVTQGTYTIVTAYGDKVVNLSGKSDQATDKNGTNVMLWEATGSNMQRFRVSQEIGNSCRLYAMSSANGYGRVLDVYRGNRSALQAGMNIDLWEVSRDTDQQWLIEQQPDGNVMIRLASNPSLVLTCERINENGANIYLDVDTGSANQFWKLR